MVNIDLGQVPAESLVIPALIVAGGFIYFFPHLKNHYFKKGEEKGRNDAFVDKVVKELRILRDGQERHERKLNNHTYRITSIERALKISFQNEETPNGSSKGSSK